MLDFKGIFHYNIDIKLDYLLFFIVYRMTMSYKDYHDFIYDALRDRFEICKERQRASDEENDIFDRFAEMVAESWVSEGDTPSSIVDNRCINWYSGDYKDYIRGRRGDDKDFTDLLERDQEERSEEELCMIEDDIRQNGGDYDRSSFYFHI